MKNIQGKFLAVLASAALLTLAGCWDDDNDEDLAPVVPPVVAASVPDSAGLSVSAFFSYLLSLASNDESTEPLLIRDSFAVPPEESTEPSPLV